MPDYDAYAGGGMRRSVIFCHRTVNNKGERGAKRSSMSNYGVSMSDQVNFPRTKGESDRMGETYRALAV